MEADDYLPFATLHFMRTLTPRSTSGPSLQTANKRNNTGLPHDPYLLFFLYYALSSFLSFSSPLAFLASFPLICTLFCSKSFLCSCATDTISMALSFSYSTQQAFNSKIGILLLYQACGTEKKELSGLRTI